MVPMSQSQSQSQSQSMKNALEFLKIVKDTFQDNGEMYSEFLKVIKQSKDSSMSNSCLKSRVKELFKDHQELIFGFNAIMPRHCQITPENGQPLLRRPDTGDLMDFMDKVKVRFQIDDRSYKSFQEMLRMHREGKKSIDEVCDEVFNVVLRNDHDLRVEFCQLLE